MTSKFCLLFFMIPYPDIEFNFSLQQTIPKMTFSLTIFFQYKQKIFNLKFY